MINTINPTTEQIIKTYNLNSYEEVKSILSNSFEIQAQWCDVSLKNKSKLLLKLAKLLKLYKEIYARSITEEMGKPIDQSHAEIEKCILVCKHYAEYSADYLKPQILGSNSVKYEPLGVILGVMPWNFPFWQVFRFVIPSLMAGNTVVVKLAENCAGCGLLMQKLFLEAGFFNYCFNNVLIDHAMCADLISDARIAAVSLTGGANAGSNIAANAGKHLKKVVLELGGNDPYLILADADLELAVKICVNSRLNNTGQVCIAAKRIIVLKKIMPEFKRLLLKEIESLSMGDPMCTANKIGPMAKVDLREKLHMQIKDSISQGANCLLGGKMPDKSITGYFYPITILENITKNMPAYKEELFGPVFCLFNVENEADAINLANDSIYGLGAAVFTKNIDKAKNIADKIKAGTVAINTMVTSDPKLPFGGIKSSGYGRELSQEGIQEFTNIKTILIK